MRVAILTEIISPYRIPLFNRLAEYPDIDLTVIFLSETEGLRNWHVDKAEIRFDYEVLPGRVVAKTYQNGSLFFNPSVVSRLRHGRFDTVVFGGYHHPSYWLALAYCRFAKKPVILWSESTLRDHRKAGHIRSGLKRRVIRSFDRYVVPGLPQQAYLDSFGVQTQDVFRAPNCVDVAYFTERSQDLNRLKSELKQDLELCGDVILFVGRLIPEKGVGDLLEAFAQICTSHDVTLLIVGTGPYEELYRQRVAEQRLPVVFAGFIQQSDLAQMYAVADIFAFPTWSDTWGLVLNEAMSCGLPIIASRAAGAVSDLVQAGVNGLLHEPHDVDGLVTQIEILLHSKELQTRMGERSLELIQGFTPEVSAAGFRDAIMSERRHD